MYEIDKVKSSKALSEAGQKADFTGRSHYILFNGMEYKTIGKQSPLLDLFLNIGFKVVDEVSPTV